MLRPTHRYWLSSVCTIKFGNRLKRYFYKMNETENRAEEDASWSNFRLTIQQVLFMSGYSDVSLTNTSRFMMQRPCGSLRSHSIVWWSSIPPSLYVSALHWIQQYLSISDYMTVGSLGNLLVLSTILRSSEMRTARNVLIGNLALSDLCLCVVTMPLTLVRKTSIILCYNLVTDLSMGQLFLGKEEDGHLLALLSSWDNF